jgi:hypothetical protein
VNADSAFLVERHVVSRRIFAANVDDRVYWRNALIDATEPAAPRVKDCTGAVAASNQRTI